MQRQRLVTLQSIISERYQLLILKWLGVWTEDDFTKGFLFFKQILFENNIKYVITDFRETDIHDFLLNFDTYIQQKSEIKNLEYKHLYLVDNPHKLVNVHRYADLLKKLNTEYFYCTTLIKAIELLQLKIDEEQLNRIIQSAHPIKLT